ncbi:putative insecticidal toxin protein [Chitinispirillum alkaliphilum]|nr:putative insecticidal toxin protein [Chitinispirillum alkaliphilum]
MQGAENNQNRIDLYGEGIPGIAVRKNGTVYYKPNLGNGKFGPLEVAASFPNLGPEDHVALSDVNGDGWNEFSVQAAGMHGWFKYRDGRWEEFVPYVKRPLIDMESPNQRVIDLTGDGRGDLLITEDRVMRWYPSLGEEGYGESREVFKAVDEREGPALVFSDPTESIYLADMTGDGLTDIVRIRSGEVCYWPNLGFGHFGRKKVMMNSPLLEQYGSAVKQQYIRLGDISGTGTTDLLYFGNGKVEYWCNESGERFGKVQTLPVFPPVDSLSTVALMDLKGTGTLSLVWSSSRPGTGALQLSYVDLLAEKPHLLVSVDNNMGSLTEFSYSSSVQMYLADKAAGRPWLTKLPYPVHVVDSVTVHDLVGDNHHRSRYRYAHGYFDPNEREFNGFGFVETVDSEKIGSGEASVDVTPVITKEWYHTGAYKANKVTAQYKQEYWQGDSESFDLPDSVIEDRESITAQEIVDAVRALKNSLLRQEVFDEESENPYLVTENRGRVKVVQRLGRGEHNEHTVCMVLPEQNITYEYDRTTDPRISQSTVIKTDEYGVVRQEVSLVYPRRNAQFLQQRKGSAVLEINDISHIDTETVFLLQTPIQHLSYELGISPDALQFLTVEALKQKVLECLDNILPFSSVVTPNTARLLTHTQNYYWNEAQSDALSLGQVGSHRLLHHTAHAVFDSEIPERMYGEGVGEEDLEHAGYQFRDGYYWNPGLVQYYLSREEYHLPVATEDPFGARVTVTWDDYLIAPVRTEDALQNSVTAEIDYRHLAPWRLTDPNGNVSEALFDELGMVIATSVYGTEKVDGVERRVGDNSLDDYKRESVVSIDEIIDNPWRFLQTATTFFYYDLHAYVDRNEPVQFVQLARERHVNEVPGAPAKAEESEGGLGIQISLGYSDGFGRELQSKLKVEPGKAWVKQPDGSFVEEEVTERWLVSGRTVYNNKAEPVKQYEPFYAATHTFQSEEFVSTFGVTPVIHYDPILRVVRTDLPDGHFTRVEYAPWEVRSFDQNDNAQGHEHFNTPSVAILDAMGREFRVSQYLKNIDDTTEEDTLTTISTFDIAGNPITVTDPRGNVAFTYSYDMDNQVLRTQNIDAGDDRNLINVMGNPLKSFDSRGHTVTVTYDALHRPLEKHVTGNELDNLVERIVYGEGIADAEALNLRGHVYQTYDEAGYTLIERYTFKGEVPKSRYKLRALDPSDYAKEADWNVDTVEGDYFDTFTYYDALGRVIRQTKPDESVTESVFHQSGLLNKVKVQLKNETEFTEFVTGISHNAKGQRERIDYGNGTHTEYEYDDKTFRLISLKTAKNGNTALLQDIEYEYDPVGNVVEIIDDSFKTVFHAGQEVVPKCTFEYDALYRLTRATGREHRGLNQNTPQHGDEWFNQHLANINDANALANYTRTYSYGKGNNLTRIQHLASDSTRSFTRNIKVDSGSNRAVPDTMTGTILSYFDLNGNCTELEHLAEINWNYRDNISKATIIKRPGGIDDAEYYIYDGGGNRVRKITIANGEKIEKIYLGGVEIRRISTGSSLILERYDHHVMDDTSRIAIVNHWMQDDFLRETDSPSDLNKNKIRYQYGNHLGSASLELNDTGALISYEEYFPYGGTSFTCGTNQKEVKLKEYRYTGKERDEATGLYYYGARYYAAWIGRWLSADPAGPVDGLNLYEYVRGNPVGLLDPDGRESRNYLSFSNEEDPDWLKPDGSFIAAVPSEWEVRFYSAWAEARNLFADDGLLSFECIKRDYERVQGEKRKLEVERQRFWLAQLEARGRITDTWQGSLGLIIAASQDGFRDGCWNYDKWVVRGERYATGINVGLMVVGGVAAAKSSSGNQIKTVPVSNGGVPGKTVPKSVLTAHGRATQSTSPEAITALDQVKSGAQLYRTGTTGFQNTRAPQFWSLKNPAHNPGYAKDMGMPQGTNGGYRFIMGGSYKQGSDIITRSAPGIGSNTGGKMEAVAQPGGVKIDWFYMK